MAEGVVPAASGATTAFRSIDELAELCGHYCWVERRIFEVTGSRASRPGSGETGAGEAEVRVALGQMSACHGFFAAQWRDRLPVRAGVDAGALIVAPPGPFGQALDLIESEPDLLHVLGGLASQILPRLVERYGRHLAQASPVSEAPVRAVLEWAVLSTGGEIELAGLLLDRLAPEGERARSVGDFGALAQGLFEGASDSSPGARAS